MCYGNKTLEFAKGKNAIELASKVEVADKLRKVREATELDELDALIEQQTQFGRRVMPKNKCTKEQKSRRTELSVLSMEPMTPKQEYVDHP